MRACSTALRPWQGDHSSSGFSRSCLVLEGRASKSSYIGLEKVGFLQSSKLTNF
jgi:hypothetical protein